MGEGKGRGKGVESSPGRSDQKTNRKQPKTVIAKLKSRSESRNPLSGAALRRRMNSKNAAAEKGKKSRGLDMEEVPCPFDSMIFLGDLNYRLDLPRLEVRASAFACNTSHYDVIFLVMISPSLSLLSSLPIPSFLLSLCR